MDCELCGEPMPEGETMFKFHGYSGNCPKPPLQRAALARPAPGVMGCKPIETAPKDGTARLLYWKHAGWMRGRFVADEKGTGWMCDGDQVMPRNQRDCTHWAPLPPPPTTGE